MEILKYFIEFRLTKPIILLEATLHISYFLNNLIIIAIKFKFHIFKRETPIKSIMSVLNFGVIRKYILRNTEYRQQFHSIGLEVDGYVLNILKDKNSFKNNCLFLM